MSVARLLYVVSPVRLDLFAYLRMEFADTDEVRVIVDRRGRERRVLADPVGTDRRTAADRRQLASKVSGLGWSLVILPRSAP